jgi:GST-like protein
MFESGAILFYLASKSGKFLPSDLGKRWAALQWTMFQMGHIGPMLGQTHHFRNYAKEKLQYAIDRYTNEAKRLYGVLDRRLAHSEHVACDEYSIADMAIWPWVRNPANQGVDTAQFPHFRRWFDAIAARPAVQRGVQVLAHLRKPVMDDKAKEILFGATQYQKR